MVSATQAFEEVRSRAEEIRNDETAAVGTVSPGDVVRQGDLYLVCVTGHLPGGKFPRTDRRQLAPGTTQGSRHVLQGEAEVLEVPGPEAAQAVRAVLPKAELFPELMGPVFKTLGPCELDHPEHGNRVLPAGEAFAVVYQRAFADTVRRQQD